MLDDDRPIMDGRWGDEVEFQEQKAFESRVKSEGRTERMKVGTKNDVYRPRLNLHLRAQN
jgi:hypothetical protein